LAHIKMAQLNHSNHSLAMGTLGQVIETNHTGIVQLSLGQVEAAYTSFGQGLFLLQSLQIPAEIFSPRQTMGCQSSCPVRLRLLTDMYTNTPSDDQLCQIDIPADEASHPTVEFIALCSAAMVYNCAIACEHWAAAAQRDECAAWNTKSVLLFRKSLEIFHLATGKYDCSSLIASAVREMAGVLYELGDWQASQSILNELFQKIIHQLSKLEVVLTASAA